MGKALMSNEVASADQNGTWTLPMPATPPTNDFGKLSVELRKR
jgi:hypothetical protein